jgi:ribosomal protein S7/energy-coupling factor transporter ATP-binding protein EcfA2
MTTLFISHSSKDVSWSKAVHDALKGKGYQLFLDVHAEDGIHVGANWEQRLYQVLRQCRGVVALVSAHWLASPWCVAEVLIARERGKPVFLLATEEVTTAEPTGAGADARPTIPNFLKDRQYIPLSGLDPQQIIEELLRGLHAEGISDDFPLPQWPYPGLEPFTAKEAAIFFGRDGEIGEVNEILNRRLRNNAKGFILVLGASGCGKSSLIRAGVLPRLTRQRENVLNSQWVIPPPFKGHRGLGGLAMSLTVALREAGLPTEEDIIYRRLKAALEQANGIQEAVRVLDSHARGLLSASALPEGMVLLVLDQLEEVFGGPEESEQRKMLRLLLEASAELASSVTVLATIRSDYLNAFQLFDGAADRYERIALDPMVRSRFGEVIESPAKLFGLGFEHGLIQRMADDTKYEDALPLLAFTLKKLYSKCNVQVNLTHEAYETLGGVSSAISHEADKILSDAGYANLPESDVRIRDLRRAFYNLVELTEGDDQYIRRTARWSELPATCKGILERFINQRLLKSDSENGERTLTVAHEALFRNWPLLTNWFRADNEFLRWQRHMRFLAEHWKGEEDRDGVLRGRQLEEAEHYLDQRSDDIVVERVKRFIKFSIRCYDEDTGIHEANSLWSYIEFHDLPVNSSEIYALRRLTMEPREKVREAFCKSTTSSVAISRKFNRMPDVVIRAIVGVSGKRRRALANSVLLRMFEGAPIPGTEISLVTLAAAIAPDCAAVAAPAIDCALEAIKKTRDPSEIKTLADAAHALAPTLVNEAANTAIDRALCLVTDSMDINQVQAFLHIILALKPAEEQAARSFARAIAAIQQATDFGQIEALAEAARAFTPLLGANRTVTAIESVIAAIDETAHGLRLVALADTVHALSPALDDQQVAIARRNLLLAIERTTDGLAVQAFARAIQVLQPRAEEASAAVRCCLSAIENSESFEVLQLLAKAAAALAPTMNSQQTAELFERALDIVINGESQGISRVPLAYAIQAFTTTPEQIKNAVDRISDVMFEKTKSSMSEATLYSLARAIQAIALSPEQASGYIGHGLSYLRNMWDYGEYAAEDMLKAIQGDDPLAPEHTAKAADRPIDAIARTKDPDGMEVCLQGIRTVAPMLNREDANASLDRALLIIAGTNEPLQMRALAHAVCALAPSPEHAAQAIERALVLIEKAIDPDDMHALACAIQTLRPAVRNAIEATSVIDRALVAIRETDDPAQVQALARTVHALAPLPEQAAQALDRTLIVLQKSHDIAHVQALADAIQFLGPSAQQAAQALDCCIAATEDYSHGWRRQPVLDALGQTMSALARKLDEQRSATIIDRAFKGMSKTNSFWPIFYLGEVVESLAPKLGKEITVKAVDTALDQIVQHPNPCEPLARFVQALAPKLDKQSATKAFDRAIIAMQEVYDRSTPEHESYVQIIRALAPSLDKRSVLKALRATFPRIKKIRYPLQVVESLASKLDQQSATKLVDTSLAAMIKTDNAHQREEMVKVAQALVLGLHNETATKLVGKVLAAIETSKCPILESYASIVRDLAPSLDRQIAAKAVEIFLAAMRETNDQDMLRFLARTVKTLAPRLDTLNVVVPLRSALTGIKEARFPFLRESLIQVVQSLTQGLNEQSAANFLDTAFGEIETTKNRDALESFAQVVQAIAPRLDTHSAAEALHRAFTAVNNAHDSADVHALEAIIDALTQVPKAAAEALSPVLAVIEGTESQDDLLRCARAIYYLGPTLEPNARKRAEAGARMVLKNASDKTIGRAGVDAAIAVAQNNDDQAFVESVFDALKFPMTAGDATGVALEALKTRFPEAAEVFSDLWIAVDWVERSFPNLDLLRQPECVPDGFVESPFLATSDEL